eukprot:Sspe_Gene.101972::Locus_76662_Transcript_1_1_Confidence_1.000_Length_1119::g.101972::m.101972
MGLSWQDLPRKTETLHWTLQCMDTAPHPADGTKKIRVGRGWGLTTSHPEPEVAAWETATRIVECGRRERERKHRLWKSRKGRLQATSGCTSPSRADSPRGQREATTTQQHSEARNTGSAGTAKGGDDGEGRDKKQCMVLSFLEAVERQRRSNNTMTAPHGKFHVLTSAVRRYLQSRREGMGDSIEVHSLDEVHRSPVEQPLTLPAHPIREGHTDDSHHVIPLRARVGGNGAGGHAKREAAGGSGGVRTAVAKGKAKAGNSRAVGGGCSNPQGGNNLATDKHTTPKPTCPTRSARGTHRGRPGSRPSRPTANPDPNATNPTMAISLVMPSPAGPSIGRKPKPFPLNLDTPPGFSPPTSDPP